MADVAVPITAEPKVDQLVEHDGRTYRTIKEGRAYILVPPNAKTQQDPRAKAKAGNESAPQNQNVFYNPIQQFNRDLSVLAIKAFGEDFCQKQSTKREQLKQKQKNDGRRDRRKERKAAHVKRKRDEDDEEGAFVKWRKMHNGDTGVPDQEPGEPQDQLEIPGKDGEGDGGVSLGDGEKHESNDLVVGDDSVKPQENEGQTDEAREEHTQQPQQPWQPRFRILDALSATGLRALRYAQEIPFATSIVANDMDKGATESIAFNVRHNKVEAKVTASVGNAIGHMYAVAFPPHNSHGPNHVSAKYDVIDLDPYGTAAPFIDAALQAVNDGGLLCVTCTDSGVFASCGYSEKTFSLYGGMPVKSAHAHEAGLRLIVHSIATAAAKIGLAIEPLLCLSIDFYARVFIRIRKSPADVKFLAGKTMLAYECDVGCGAWTTQLIGRNVKQPGKNDTTFFKYSINQAPKADQHCEHCGSKTHIAGPMWAGPLHNAAFIEKILEDVATADKSVYSTMSRIEGMLDTALDELSVNDQAVAPGSSSDILPKVPPEIVDHAPFFFITSVLSKVLHCQAPPEAALKGALRHAGYRVARSHCKPGSIKTDAPWTAIWQVMREWVRQKAPLREGSLKETQPGWMIMQAAKAPEEQANGQSAEAGGGCSSSKGSSPDVVTDAAAAATLKAAKEKPKDPSKMKVVFDEALGRDRPGKRLVRYQVNPRENWGPMSRAKGSA